MSQVNMNEYKVIQQDGTVTYTVRSSFAAAAAAFDSTTNPVVQIVRTAVDRIVGTGELVTVTFQTAIAGSGAETAGCQAYPITATVADGTNVIFSAVPAEGYTFTGWFDSLEEGATALSTNAVATLEIEHTGSVIATKMIYAKFTAVV